MKRLALAAPLLLGAPAYGQQWFPLSGRDIGPSTTQVEVDLDTVRMREGSADAAIRVTHDVLQPHPGGFGYRSFMATANIDCMKRTIAVASAAYYALGAGQGARVGVDGSASAVPPVVLERMPMHARQALLRAACQGTGSP